MIGKISNINDIFSNQETQFLFLHRYLYGGGTTFTAHLLHKLCFRRKNIVLRCVIRSENRLRDFGYGLSYRNISTDLLKDIRHPFITLIKDNYLHVIHKLNERKNTDEIILVVHDYLKNKYNLDSLFLHHPFYPYPIISKDSREGTISISRISFEKNIDVIIKANKYLNEQQQIKLFGRPSRMYVHFSLGSLKKDFNKYYYGQFNKSFSTLSEMLAKVKFVIDLSSLKWDGGGTQYTFLEAIHNGCGLILHRKWLEGNDIPREYCDFKENYNCFAVENETELAELIKKDPDPARIVKNARKLMKRHIEVDWSQLLRDGYTDS